MSAHLDPAGTSSSWNSNTASVAAVFVVVAASVVVAAAALESCPGTLQGMMDLDFHEEIRGFHQGSQPVVVVVVVAAFDHDVGSRQSGWDFDNH